jgi:hypothetical protein
MSTKKHPSVKSVRFSVSVDYETVRRIEKLIEKHPDKGMGKIISEALDAFEALEAAKPESAK